MKNYFVNTTSGKNVLSGGSEEKPWRTVQFAIDHAHDGGVINITGSEILKMPLSFKNPPTHNKPFIFRGGELDGNGDSIYNGDDSFIVFDKVTLKNAGSQPILVFGGNSVYVIDCTLFGGDSAIQSWGSISVGGCDISDIDGDAAILGNDLAYIYRNKIDGTYTKGIELRGGTASGNLVYQRSLSGAAITGPGRIVENTLINLGGEGSSAVAIQLYGNHLVANNYTVGFSINPASSSSDSFTISIANLATSDGSTAYEPAISKGNVNAGALHDDLGGTARRFMEGWPYALGEMRVGINRGASQVPPAEEPDYPEERHVRKGVVYGDGRYRGAYSPGGGKAWR